MLAFVFLGFGGALEESWFCVWEISCLYRHDMDFVCFGENSGHLSSWHSYFECYATHFGWIN